MPTATPAGYLYEAGRVADRLPAEHYQPWTSFSRVIMGTHTVTVAVELRRPGEALRAALRTAAATIPSRPRRARCEVCYQRHPCTEGRKARATVLILIRAAFASARAAGAMP